MREIGLAFGVNVTRISIEALRKVYKTNRILADVENRPAQRYARGWKAVYE